MLKAVEKVPVLLCLFWWQSSYVPIVYCYRGILLEEFSFDFSLTVILKEDTQFLFLLTAVKFKCLNHFSSNKSINTTTNHVCLFQFVGKFWKTNLVIDIITCVLSKKVNIFSSRLVLISSGILGVNILEQFFGFFDVNLTKLKTKLSLSLRSI